MPTVVKSWDFPSDTMGLADAGLASSVVFDYVASDPSVKFFCGFRSITQTEQAVNPATGETWETWGVPAGAHVTGLQITAWQYRLVNNLGLTGHSLKVRIVDSADASVHSAGELLSTALGTSTDASFFPGGSGPSRAVDSAKQASATDVRLELEYAISTGAVPPMSDVQQRFTEIDLTITYDVAGDISGSSAGTSTVTGTLSATGGIAGTSVGTSTVTGTIEDAQVPIEPFGQVRTSEESLMDLNCSEAPLFGVRVSEERFANASS